MLLPLLLFVSDHVAFSGQKRFVDPSATPVDDDRFSDGENHDGDLSDGEEAPNRSLFHQAGGDETSQERPSREEEDSLDDHSFLFVEGEERREHQKRMESNSGDDISRVSHGHRP